MPHLVQSTEDLFLKSIRQFGFRFSTWRVYHDPKIDPFCIIAEVTFNHNYGYDGALNGTELCGFGSSINSAIENLCSKIQLLRDELDAIKVQFDTERQIAKPTFSNQT